VDCGCRWWIVNNGNHRRGFCHGEAKQGIFIAGDRPVTEDQVRQKLQSDGWSNVRILREGRYLEAMGSKNGQIVKVAVDAQTGRLRAADDEDED